MGPVEQAGIMIFNNSCKGRDKPNWIRLDGCWNELRKAPRRGKRPSFKDVLGPLGQTHGSGELVTCCLPHHVFGYTMWLSTSLVDSYGIIWAFTKVSWYLFEPKYYLNKCSNYIKDVMWHIFSRAFMDDCILLYFETRKLSHICVRLCHVFVSIFFFVNSHLENSLKQYLIIYCYYYGCLSLYSSKLKDPLLIIVVVIVLIPLNLQRLIQFSMESLYLVGAGHPFMLKFQLSPPSFLSHLFLFLDFIGNKTIQKKSFMCFSIISEIISCLFISLTRYVSISIACNFFLLNWSYTELIPLISPEIQLKYAKVLVVYQIFIFWDRGIGTAKKTCSTACS
ncbi:hypothetical protein VP01_729g4 [Puccinia sorghi]|uniref:Uncharacterized protein n=1 Tax=Puccinia sorghi TaxID=27349 RepID=A0A0L6UCX7_9BASI|nr:hypothetical protein VP01_729g4 [Puccinia sorghi]